MSNIQLNNCDIVKFDYILLEKLPKLKIEGECIAVNNKTFELRSYNVKHMGSGVVYRTFFKEDIVNDNKVQNFNFILQNKKNHRKKTEL